MRRKGEMDEEERRDGSALMRLYFKDVLIKHCGNNF